jgi:hypothetical protein
MMVAVVVVDGGICEELSEALSVLPIKLALSHFFHEA